MALRAPHEETTAFAVLAAISFSHLLNDTIQSLLPAIYPLLKTSFALSFTQVGLMTLALMLTASLLQPVVGLYTDRRPTPYALVVGMGFTLVGLLLLSVARHVRAAARSRPGWSASARRCSIPSRRASRAWRRAGGTAWRSRCFRSAATSARRSARCSAAFLVVPRGQSSIAWCSLLALLGIVVLCADRRLVQRRSGSRRPTRSAGGAAAGGARRRCRRGASAGRSPFWRR